MFYKWTTEFHFRTIESMIIGCMPFGSKTMHARMPVKIGGGVRQILYFMRGCQNGILYSWNGIFGEGLKYILTLFLTASVTFSCVITRKTLFFDFFCRMPLFVRNDHRIVITKKTPVWKNLQFSPFYYHFLFRLVFAQQATSLFYEPSLFAGWGWDRVRFPAATSGQCL